MSAQPAPAHINLDCLISRARILVREAGYAAQKIEAQGERGEMYSCVVHIYDLACAHLMRIDPTHGAEFIRATYGPAFRQTQKES